MDLWKRRFPVKNHSFSGTLTNSPFNLLIPWFWASTRVIAPVKLISKPKSYCSILVEWLKFIDVFQTSKKSQNDKSSFQSVVCQTKLNTQNSPSLPKINSIFIYSHLATAIPTRFPTGGPNRSSHLPPGPITWHQRVATKNSTRPGCTKSLHWRFKGSKESSIGKPGDS